MNVEIVLDIETLVLGLIIFVARVTDVTLGTLRTVSIVQGRTKMAFFLGFVEISLWLVVISAVINKITTNPLLGFFYALGFSTGNVVGIMLERRLAFGHLILRIISRKDGRDMAEKIRAVGYGVTIFQGEGMHGPVLELYVVCRRKDLSEILPCVIDSDPDAFYTTQPVGLVNRVYRPMLQPPTGWRATFKKK